MIITHDAAHMRLVLSPERDRQPSNVQVGPLAVPVSMLPPQLCEYSLGACHVHKLREDVLK